MEKMNKIYLASIIGVVFLCCITTGVSFEIGRIYSKNQFESEVIPYSNVNLTAEYIFNAVDYIIVDLAYYNQTDYSTVNRSINSIDEGGLWDTFIMFEWNYDRGFGFSIIFDLDDFNQPNTIVVLELDLFVEFKDYFQVELLESFDLWSYDTEFGATICWISNWYKFV